MIDLAIISGSGFYDFPALKEREEREIANRFGRAVLLTGRVHDRQVAFLARHGRRHEILPHLIDHRANLLALKEMGARALVATTVCGVLDPALPLGRLIVFDDLFFPENRLPDGNLCSIFDVPGDKQQGHYLFRRPFSQLMREQLMAASEAEPIGRATYAHVNGPRFNSQAEIEMLRQHADCVSQTAGPEIVLAGELEIPCALLGFGVDYATGVSEVPTPVEELKANLERSPEVFQAVISAYLRDFEAPAFEGFIYRFE